MPELGSERELSSWLSRPSAETFPYDIVVDAYQRVGKHFVPAVTLDALAAARRRLPGVPGSAAALDQLARFLDVALDKRDGRYDYGTYLALDLLPLTSTDTDGDTPEAQRAHDRLFAHLIADAVRFELDVRDGRSRLLPLLRPDAPTTTKRLRLAARAAHPALTRLGLAGGVPGTANGAGPDPGGDPGAAARRLADAVRADMTAADRRAMRLSMLPVWVAHDEYMFIRVLQAFETTFALVAVRLRAAVEALAGDAPSVATAAIDAAHRSLDETARTFSLMATMQIESFQKFREYTHGASAIQSRNYKILESLCARPDESRLDSPAYHSVPEVRERLLGGQANLDDILAAAVRDRRLAPASRAELTAAMRRFELTLLQWRQTHYRLAIRMLGDRAGTGYTEGTPYLKAVRTIRVFSASGTE